MITQVYLSSRSTNLRRKRYLCITTGIIIEFEMPGGWYGHSGPSS